MSSSRNRGLAGRIDRITEVPMLVLAFLYVPAFIIGYLPGVSPSIRSSAGLVQLVGSTPAFRSVGDGPCTST